MAALAVIAVAPSAEVCETQDIAIAILAFSPRPQARM